MTSRFLKFAAFAVSGLLWAGLALAQVNINNATREQLDGLKGIGPVRAQAILDYRRKNGPFKSVDDLQNVPGIGPATVKELRRDVIVSGASRAPMAIPAPAPRQETARPTLRPATPAARPAAPNMPAKPAPEAKAKPAMPAAPAPARPQAAPASPAMPGAKPAAPAAPARPAGPAVVNPAASPAKPAMPGAAPAKPAAPAAKPASPVAKPAGPAMPARPAQPAAY
ncbi:MAG: competence protein ComEA [Betaproteobacteria bacterium HGW-Betaproteobacteria-4]|nr:MAG: competence protein ComEA [Betaproteobacteria bacterium HGW-Betaproteobacteria-4]